LLFFVSILDNANDDGASDLMLAPLISACSALEILFFCVRVSAFWKMLNDGTKNLMLVPLVSASSAQT